MRKGRTARRAISSSAVTPSSVQPIRAACSLHELEILNQKQFEPAAWNMFHVPFLPIDKAKTSEVVFRANAGAFVAEVRGPLRRSAARRIPQRFFGAAGSELGGQAAAGPPDTSICS